MEQRLRLFVDMDGTLAEFRQVLALEELYEPGYFARLPPQQNVVDAVRLLIHSAPAMEIFILSSVLFDSRFAMEEKNGWLDRYLPELNPERRVFLPCGANKAIYAPFGVRVGDILLDDYTKNLEDWSRAGGQGVKLLNGINHTRGSWNGARLSYDRTPVQLADALVEVARGRCIQDKLPRSGISTAAQELQRMALADTKHCTFQDCEPE